MILSGNIKKYLNVILANTTKGGIGINNKLPWHLKGDLEHFKNLTSSYNLDHIEKEQGYKNAIIMGKKTFESLGDKFPLSHRRNIVLSKSSTSP